MSKSDFENLRVFQMAERLADEVWEIVKPWDGFAKRTVGQQIVRAADSVGANIAEGAGVCRTLCKRPIFPSTQRLPTMTIPKELLDQLLEHCDDPQELLTQGGFLHQLTGRLVERALEGEMTDHLGYPKSDPAGKGSGNSRNGHSAKTLKSEHGDVTIRVPRDRGGHFEPVLVPKHERRLPALDDKILSLYARGMSTREIQGHLRRSTSPEELYHTEVSPTLISNVTAAVLDEVAAWQSRPLDALYPILYLDALFVKVRHEGRVQPKAVYLALGVNLDGEKELLGLWIAEAEGAKFWLRVLTELRNRGVEDVLICCVDGLTGFSEAIATVYPQTLVQLCIVHMVRGSLRFVNWKDRKAVARDLRAIYRAPTEAAGRAALAAFGERWDTAYPTIRPAWERHWDELSTFYAFPEEIRRVIYTTNAIEAVNRQLRKVLKTRGALPSDEAVLKLLYLALQRASEKWTRPIQNWPAALGRFAIEFEGRVPLP
jgi:putative transposase